jgi:lantibiotic biosynthesis protein
MSGDAFVDTAFALGARLCRDALWAGDRCNWVGASSELYEGAWTVVQRSFGPDVYAGTAGIAWFLARLHRIVPEPLLLVTAEAGARQALSRLDDVAPEQRCGLWSGWSGIACALADLAEVSEGGDWAEAAEELLDRLSGVDLDGQLDDVLAGVAGAVPALLAAHRRAGAGRWLEAAVRCGDHLLARARPQADGLSWGDRFLTGFSHGASGISWVLAELAAASGEERFRRAAEAGFAYERGCFSPAHGNWPDLRDRSLPGMPASGEEPVFPLQWCHGAPGIGLARLRGWSLLGEAVLRDEAEAAIATTAADLARFPASAQPNFSLCHGVAGNADLLILAAEVLGEAAHLEAARRIGRLGVERYGAPGDPWPSGLNDSSPAPGLMLGLAGTGWFYLRLHDPAATPSALLPVPRPWPQTKPEPGRAG